MRLKSALRRFVALAAYGTGYLASVERKQRDTLTIVCYHRVLPSHLRERYFDPELVVTPETLDLHCSVLARHFEVITLEDGLADWLTLKPSLKPRAAITFDDGYRDNEKYAVPILARYGLQATFFVVSGLVGSTRRPWYDDAGDYLLRLNRNAVAEIDHAKSFSPHDRQVWLSNLAREAGATRTPATEDLIMEESALRRLRAAGHQVGSHSVTHPLLDQLGGAELCDEVEQSKTSLVAASGGPVSGFCYPNGNFNDVVQAAVGSAGYEYATSALPGINRRGETHRLGLRRWFISETRLTGRTAKASASLFRLEVNGVAHRLFRRGATP